MILSTMPDLTALVGFYWIAGGAHFDSFGYAGEPGKPLRAGGAGDDAEFHFRLADLRASDGDAIVAGHGDFEAAAESGAVNGDDHRLGAVLDFQK